MVKFTNNKRLLLVVYLMILATGYVNCQHSITYNISLCNNQSQVLKLFANASLVSRPDLDIYFAPSTNYGSTKYMYNYYLPIGLYYLKPVFDAVIASNNNTRFGAGTFSTKRNIGWPNDRDFVPAVNMTQNTSAILAAITPIFGDPLNPYVLDVEAVDQTSFLDAFLNVMQLSESYNFRHGSKRVFFTITNLPYAVQGDVWPNMNSPNSLFPVAFDTESNIITSFPLNNLDGVLYDDCVLFGMVCSEIWGLQRMVDDLIECNKPLYSGFIDKRNVTQFAAGSCEDFPLAEDVATIAQDKGFDLWVILQHDPFTTDGVDPDTLAQFAAFVGNVSGNSALIPASANLSVVLPQLVSAYWLPTVTVIKNGSSLGGITENSCNATSNLCEVDVTVVYGNGTNQTLVIYVEGLGTVTINVSKCAQSQSETQSVAPTHTSGASVHPSGSGNSNDLIGLWVSIGVGGSLLLIILLVFLFACCANQPKRRPSSTNTSSYIRLHQQRLHQQ